MVLGLGLLLPVHPHYYLVGLDYIQRIRHQKGKILVTGFQNLVDKGINYVSGDTNNTLGTKLYDILNSDESITNNIPTPGSIIKTPIQTPSIEPAKDKIISELISKQETNNTHTITASNSTMSTSAMTDKTSIIKEPEPLTDAKQLELNKIETEKEDRQQTPIIINNQQPVHQKQQMSPGHGGGQSIAPMVTRVIDSSLGRVADKLIGNSL